MESEQESESRYCKNISDGAAMNLLDLTYTPPIPSKIEVASLIFQWILKRQMKIVGKIANQASHAKMTTP